MRNVSLVVLGLVVVLAVVLLASTGESPKTQPRAGLNKVDLEDPVRHESDARQNCYWLSYWCNTGQYYYWRLPDIYQEDFYNQRFTPTGVCTLMTVSMQLYDQYPEFSNISGNGIEIFIWDDDGFGFPGTLRHVEHVPGPSLVFNPFWLTVDVSYADLIFTGDFHVGYTVLDKQNDDIALLSDYATCGQLRSSETIAGIWGLILNNWGVDVNFLIEVYLCCDQGPIEIWWKEPEGIYMPDFDQYQQGWSAYCGPVAAANCLWWFDSRFPDWDLIPDHFDATTFIEALAFLMSTNGPVYGTHIDSMQSGVRQWLDLQNCEEYLVENTVWEPTYEYCRDELMACQDVILLLGYWFVLDIYEIVPNQHYEIDWYRDYGHFVTMAGVDSAGFAIGISDPADDAFEDGTTGGRMLGQNHTHPLGHNDGVSVSHDVYRVSTMGISPGGLWELPDYVWGKKGFPEDYEHNTNPNPRGAKDVITDWYGPLPPWVYTGAMVTEVEAAVIICPIGADSMYWKPDTTYGETGMPDFPSQYECHSGPTAVTNCLWWYGAMDYYPFGDPRELKDELFVYFGTDTDFDPWGGTDPYEMQRGLTRFFWDVDPHWQFYETTYPYPDFDEMAESLLVCQDIILLIGNWWYDGQNWWRDGGRWVTMAGVNKASRIVALSDPETDNAEAGGAGRVRPPGHTGAPHDPQDDTHWYPTTPGGYDYPVSHDQYQAVLQSPSPGGQWYLEDFPRGFSPTHANCPLEHKAVTAPNPDPYIIPYHAEVEYAVMICPGEPVPPPHDTVTCEPQPPNHPPTFWYRVAPGAFGRCDFHVKVSDPFAGNYSGWVEPAGWQHSVHKVGDDWWVSWWNPGCANAIFSPFTFKFTNSGDAVWGDWTTTIDGSNDPYAQVIDSSGNHDDETNGYGYKVHVPFNDEPPPPDTAVTLDNVIGLDGLGRLIAGDNISFELRMTYNAGRPLWCIVNGFRVYSPDGATWQPIVPDTVSLGWPTMFNLIYQINTYSVTGTGADTVMFGGAAMFGGLVPPFDSLSWWIDTKVYPADRGKHLCLDSCWVPPAGDWLWTNDWGMPTVPSWDGPHCYEIYGEVPPPSDSAFVLDTVMGLNAGGKLIPGANIEFIIRWIYKTGSTIGSFTNGFRVYSPDGATWQPLVDNPMSLGWNSIFNLTGLLRGYYSCNGTGADSVLFGGAAMPGGGVVPPFDKQVWSLDTKVSAADAGKHLCVDSASCPAAYQWLWNSSPSFAPQWSGPHCFEISSSCCNFRGDVDNSDKAPIDIADLVYLVDFMFNQGPPPPCYDEGDIDGSGVAPIDIADLVYLVDYMFNAGPEPPPCY